MNQEKYNLKWYTYSDHLREMLHEMMKSNELTDVTLVCDDKKQFKAHKIVLSACSSVFKSIINDLPQNSSVIYLRGIQHQEMESILQFMYLGEATFYQDRMSEFLNVAKNLEIKEISKNIKIDEENVGRLFFRLRNVGSEVSVNETDTKQLQNEPKAKADEDKNEIPGRKHEDVKYFCNHCDKQFKQQPHLKNHIQSKHEGVKYACNQCEYKATFQSSLKTHIKSQHEGVKYACNQCEYQATTQSHLKIHIQSKHEGVIYACNQCDYQNAQKQSLKIHIQSKHEGMKYACNQCDYQGAHLSKHMKSVHSKIALENFIFGKSCISEKV